MGKSVASAMKYENYSLGRTQKRSKPVSRKWAVRGELKHLESLKTSSIVWYLVKRHQVGLLYVMLLLVGIMIGWAA